MRSGSIAALVVTGILMAAVTLATGFFAFMMWALALNGFMGQEDAINASMTTFIVLAVVTGAVSIFLSLCTVYYLSVRRNWNAAVSALLSIVVFALASGILHTLCVIVSAIVAEQLRTNR